MRRLLILTAVLVSACSAQSSTTPEPAEAATEATTTTTTTTTTLATDVPNPSLVFDGTACQYTGPSEFTDTVIRFDLVNNSDTQANFSIWSVPDGTTADEIDPQDEWLDRDDFDMKNVRWGQNGPGWETTLVAALEPGYHMLNCFVLEEDATETAPASNHVTFITIAG